MNETNTQSASGNPFCTRRVRPGAIPFLFPSDHTAETLVERFQATGRQGEIIGPHGSGKSTLLAALISVFERTGYGIVLVELHDGQRRLPPDLWADTRLQGSAILVIDGYEQLNRLSRFRLKRFCRRRGMGLLITAHVPMGLPTLFQTAATPELLAKIVAYLSANQPQMISEDVLTLLFTQHRGDLREILFELYDIYEQNKPNLG